MNDAEWSSRRDKPNTFSLGGMWDVGRKNAIVSEYRLLVERIGCQGGIIFQKDLF